MAWSPSARQRRIVWVEQPGDYATFNSYHPCDGTLESAAYRLIGIAACRIDRSDGRFVCCLSPEADLPNTKTPNTKALQLRFLDLVTDENVRERLATKTEPVRNLILSLAFGSLALPPTAKG
jgi:hypothetical protein